MTTLERPIGDRALHREEVARRDLGHTDVSPVVARTIVALFLLLIAVVPAVELLAVRSRSAAGVASAWSQLVADVEPAPGPPPTTLWTRLLASNRVVLERLTGFERTLEDESVIGRALRPPAQALMTGSLGAGNERVYPGRDGWLFYRPDVEYVTGQAFLDPARLRRRVESANEWSIPPAPDPRPALLRFRDDLAARGIALVVVPAPTKAGVHPDRLSGVVAPAESGILRNPSFAALVDELSRAGLEVFDPSGILRTGRTAAPQYLATDTHWRPEVMESVAVALSARLRASVPAAADPGYRIERASVTNIGDITRMLDLPATTALYPAEEVWLRRVLQPDGTPWRAERDSEVLLLGDSFANIYSLQSMGWGTSAGLAEHLSLALGRPLDRIVQNDAGAYAPREILARDPDRLTGKRVVIYQFAERELAFGDWKVLRIPR